MLTLLLALTAAVLWVASDGWLGPGSRSAEFGELRAYTTLSTQAPGPRQGGLEPRVPPPSPGSGAWQPAGLPTQVRGDPGQQGFRLTWYALSFRAPPALAAQEGGPLALYVPRISHGAVQVLRLEEGRWIVRWDGSDLAREQWNRPLLVQVGEMPPGGEPLQLALRVSHAAGETHAITTAMVGPLTELQPLAERRELLQRVLPLISSLAFLSLGLVALFHWLGDPHERAYLYFSLTALAWTARNHAFFGVPPADPFWRQWLGWLHGVSLSWVMLFILLFALRFGTRPPAVRLSGLVLAVVLVSAVSAPWSGGEFPAMEALRPWLSAGLAASMLALLGWQARHAGTELRLLAGALGLTALAAVHDQALALGLVPPDAIYLLPLASLLIFLAFLQAAQLRYAQAVRQVETANQQLEDRLRQRESELQANHERLRQVERDQALLRERQRLMHDMHDGLGSTLMSTLVVVEQGRLEREEVVELLRECVDDLRLVIDSLEPVEQDLLTLLASLRHRLGRRLEGAGLALHWQVQDVPPLAWLHPPDALQILRLVQEALTNVLKHSRASQVSIEVHQQGEDIEVAIVDDGVGFDPDQVVPGRGLRHLGQRAARLGAHVQVRSAPGQGTRVQLLLPLHRSAPGH
ncbi:sensor histidine kinase [Ideonella livida]|uniref:histidine kinase n=1 Tax=Ideonella livida TaxID=2707176 RepID=A0A7C9PJ46_9BURK|nr:ATP-binding protein [Ideonella livida]NDY92290.1 hypothetical protein [Ideonella livida]